MPKILYIFFYVYKLIIFLCIKMKQSNYSINNIIPQKSLTQNQMINFKKKPKIKKNSKKFLNLGKKQQRERRENSLGQLTKKFIKYINKVKIDRIDLNDVVNALNIKKRRIYDISNVLEGK